MIKNKPIVYVDMDGVLADLFNHVADIHDVEHYNDMTDEEWDIFFRTTDAYHLFRDLPPFATANALVAMVRRWFGGYTILSSPLNFDKEGSIQGKKEWLQRHITIPADNWVFDHDKAKYATTEGSPNILIDDFGDYIRKWNAAGGTAIKYQADEDRLPDLERKLILLSYKTA